MSDLLFACNSVLPLFIMVYVGVVARRLDWIKREHVPVLNKICFYLFIPCMMIKTSLSADFSLLADSWIYVYGAASIVIAAFLLSLAVPVFVKERPKIAAFIHSAFRANTMLLGVPLAVNLLGETAAFPVTLMLLLASPVTNACGITVLTVFGTSEKKNSLWSVLHDVLVNPVFIGMAAGLLLALLKIELPSVLSEAVSSFSSAATPLAMLSIGANFKLQRLSKDFSLVAWCSAAKLLVLPVLFTAPLLLMGQKGIAVLAIYLLHATPTAATSSILTSVMGGDGNLANEVILVSTAASAFTLCFAIMLGKGFGFI